VQRSATADRTLVAGAGVSGSSPLVGSQYSAYQCRILSARQGGALSRYALGRRGVVRALRLWLRRSILMNTFVRPPVREQHGLVALRDIL